MKDYLVHIFCLTADYHKQLPSAFIDLGYTVSSAWKNTNNSFSKRGIVSIIAYKLRCEEDRSNEDVCDDVKIVFNNIKGYFYGAMVNTQVMHGNINGDTDISRVLQMRALW
jgi:hypothetical protein